MSTSRARRAAKHRSRRAENFGVRRWLQIGVVSTGMGAALFGFSSMGPQIGTASADDTSSSSSASSSDSGASKDVGSKDTASSKDAGSKVGDVKTTRPTSTVAGARESPTSSTGSSTDDDAKPSSHSATSTTDRDDRASTATKDTTTGDDHPTRAGQVEETGKTATAPESNSTGHEGSVETAGSAETSGSAETTAAAETTGTAPNTGTAEKSSSASAPAAVSSAALVTTSAATKPATQPATQPAIAQSAQAVEPDPWAMQTTSGAPNSWQQLTSTQIALITANLQALINAMPVPPELRDALNGTLLTVRRTLFNLAPTVSGPVVVTSADSGPIAGRVDAVDPEGDQIVYRLVQGPRFGSVAVAADGSYTYTPGTDFNGVDSFVIAAADDGLHVNLVDWLRQPGTAAMLVNQNAITFSFTYTTGSENWDDPARRAALMQAAKKLARYVMVLQPVRLDYDVASTDDPESGNLASAGSPLISTDPGFWPTVVQNKLITGQDANGNEADGRISLNWGKQWGLGDIVGDDEVDFESTAMHELVHSFGWTAYLGPAGTNDDRTAWPIYTSFLRTVDGDSPVGDDYTWNDAFDPALTGGVFFGGANAMAAYGGHLVPLYSPAEWEQGSSVSHLDDGTFTGANEQMMNSATDDGPGVRVLSPIELGVLRDLGYITVNVVGRSAGVRL